MFPELVYFYPTELNSPVASLQPQITLDWSVDIDTAQFIQASTRAQLIVLIDDATATVLPTSYVSYTAAQRRLVLQPTSALQADRAYTIYVRRLVNSTDGRKSQQQYLRRFTTAVAAVGTPTLIAPVDMSVQTSFPTFSWTTLSGTGLMYQFEMDNNPTFGSLTYTVLTSGASLIPAGSFTDEVTYFWRVRAYTTTTSGGWTEAQSFYSGSIDQAHITTRSTWADSDTFGVTSQGFTDGASHQASWPTISITFTSAPASTYTNHVTFKKRHVKPRNDTITTYDQSDVAGSWALSGATITFTPSETIATNKRYDIVLKTTMTNTAGVALGEGYPYYFTGQYTPYYCDLMSIRAKFLGAELRMPDDLINYQIYSTSLEANARYYGDPLATSLIGDMLTESIVRDSNTLKSYAVGRWVEAAVYYKLLRGILNESLRLVGRDRQLGDYKESLSADFIKGIKEALEGAKEEVQQYENQLMPTHVAMGTDRNIAWLPNNYLMDNSISDHEGRRHL